jgi:hypothetical protein
MDDRFAAGREFLLREGRLLERRLFATCFEGAPAAGVVDALRGYRTDDGGFGHALEPDKRCPESLPLDVENAFQALVTAGTNDAAMVAEACDYLVTVADGDGAVPLTLPVIERYPRAVHLTDWTYRPDVNPTAGLAGLLYRLGATHPWLDRATEYCWRALTTGELSDDAHALSEALVFLANVPDSDRAGTVAKRVVDHLAAADHFNADPGATGYGLTPLSIAPTATSRWRDLFPADAVEAHLDRLERDQQPDGGWPIAWEPPGNAGLLEWRGKVTLSALLTLTSYGRLAPPR